MLNLTCSKEIKEDILERYPDKDEKTVEFISRFEKLNGRNNWDFSETNYKAAKESIVIKCINCGNIIKRDAFSLTKKKLICHNCTKANYPKTRISWLSTESIFSEEELCELKNRYPEKDLKTLEFIKRVIGIFGETKFGFDRTIYSGISNKTTLYCLKHQRYFETYPKTLLCNNNKEINPCPDCHQEYLFILKNPQLTPEKIKKIQELYPEKTGMDLLFSAKVSLLYNFRFDLFGVDLTKYQLNDLVRIRCIEHNEYFEVEKRKLLYDRPHQLIGCTNCLKEKRSIPRYSINDFTKEEIDWVNTLYNDKDLKTKEAIILIARVLGRDRLDFTPTIFKGFCEKSEFICKKHSLLFKQYPESLLLNYINCPDCHRESTSRGELRIEKWFIGNQIKFEDQYKVVNVGIFSSCKIDFRIIHEGSEYWIEYNGRQHYEPVDFFGGLESFQNYQVPRDNAIRKYAKDNGITLIEISYKDYDNIETILNKYFK